MELMRRDYRELGKGCLIPPSSDSLENVSPSNLATIPPFKLLYQLALSFYISSGLHSFCLL